MIFGALALVAAGMMLYQYTPQKPAPKQDQPLIESAEALAGGGWVVVQPPRLPGPYHRSSKGSPVLWGGAGEGLVCRVLSADGTVEEAKLQSSPDYDQRVVYLNTADGRETMAVLRKPVEKRPPG